MGLLIKPYLKERYAVVNRTPLLSHNYTRHKNDLMSWYPPEMKVVIDGKKLVAKRYGLYPDLDGWCDVSYMIAIGKRRKVVSYSTLNLAERWE